ncbi:hypothetical protein DV736_g1114, partial [Chaetothyriales sp. CBS 134916]
MSAVTDETMPKLGVDEASISPIERRNSLEKHLQHRPDAQELKNRHILLDTNAAPLVVGVGRALQAKQVELERQQHSDSLRKHLEKRPDREDLIERNILPESQAAPSLQASQKSLERHMKADQLEHQLQRRPTAEELVKQGILEENEEPGK